jgi:PadR family transcriptional regulator, regulatory protein AphA
MDVRTICLGILTRGETTGYEIKKLFEDGRYHYFVEASFGSIYPALTRLTEEGLVSVRAEAQVGRPDRKVYSITAKGRHAFAQSLLGPLPEDRYRSPFLFAMMFADQLPAGRAQAMIDDCIAQAEVRLEQLEDGCREPGDKGEAFVCEFGRTMYGAMLQYLRRRRKTFQTAAKAAE